MKAKDFSFAVTAIASWLSFAAILGCTDNSRAQAPGVPVYTDELSSDEQVMAAAEKLRSAGKLTVPAEVLSDQLYQRKSCELQLSTPRTEKLAEGDLWAIARAAHLRVGWYYHTTKSDRCLMTAGGGYALTTNGVVATCFHIAHPPEDMAEGYLVIVNESGQAYPVTEILAGDADADTCILRAAVHDLKPLALNTNVVPGQRCVCYSDPLAERGYYSEGIVSRFLAPRRDGKVVKTVTRMDVTTDWAPGSSGSAILDACGNAIGHVATMENLPKPSPGNKGSRTTLISIHEAASAKDVLALIKPPAK